MKVRYNKLVRDKIPQIIRAQGKDCVTRVLTEEEYLQMLDEKLSEELAEYHADHSPEELADLLEVIYAAAQARGCSLEQLEQLRREKAEKRGAFRERLALLEVSG